MKYFFISLLSTSFLLLSFKTADAGFIFVSPDGDDNNTGRSFEQAFRTLMRAGNIAKAGDEVIIRKGMQPYRYLPVMHSGIRGKPIVFRGEDPQNPPIITGSIIEKGWRLTSEKGIWSINTTARPLYIIEDDKPLIPATSSNCSDGSWYWSGNTLYYKPSSGTPSKHTVNRTIDGGGVHINEQSWIVINDITFIAGGGAAVNITSGSYNTIKSIHAKWCWRGINIMGFGHHNTVESSTIEENREGIYLWKGASFNWVSNNKVIHNGNEPLWRFVEGYDRSGIDIGHAGPPTSNNTIVGNYVAYNGGPNSDAGIIAFNAPNTLIKDNYVYKNYGPGINVTINSDGSRITGNRIERNGEGAVSAGHMGIFGLSIRHSSSVTVEDNRLTDNHVSPDSRWPGKGLGPKGGLDVQGRSNETMKNIILRNNMVTGTVGGPDVFISSEPKLSGLIFEPHNHDESMR